MKLTKLLSVFLFSLFYSLLITHYSLLLPAAEAAWTAPKDPFPAGNPAAPLDESATEQSKEGILNIGDKLYFTKPSQIPTLIFGNGQSVSAKNSGGAVQSVFTPLTSSDITLFTNGSGYFQFNTQGVVLPRVKSATDTSGNLPANFLTDGAQSKGMIVYDLASKALKISDGSNWSTASTQWADVTGGIIYSGNVGIGTTAPGAKLDVAGRTTKFSNQYPIYRWYWGGGEKDNDFKTIANITLGTGQYVGVEFRVDIVDPQNNWGANSDSRSLRYYANATRSGFNQDDVNAGNVSGPIADYVRMVKTATGVYELQVRQIYDWRHMQVSAQVISQNGAVTVSYIDDPVDGSAGIAIYTASAIHTEYFPNAQFSGNLKVNGDLENPATNFSPVWIDDFNSDTRNRYPLARFTLSVPDNSIVTYTTTGADPIWDYDITNFDGGINQYVALRYKVTAGTVGGGQIFYSTASHVSDALYRKDITLNGDGNWHTTFIDMHALTASGADWKNNTITAVRFDWTNDSGVTIDIDYIAIGTLAYGTRYIPDNFIVDGSVGIGTTVPGAKLDVVDWSRFQGATINTLVVDAGGFGALKKSDLTEGNLLVSGNIGIGTTAPGGILQLLGTTHTSPNTTYSSFFAGTMGMMFRASNADSYLLGNLYYNSSSKWIYASDGGGAIITFNNGSGEGSIGFTTAPSGTAGDIATLKERMTILQGGYVGIGTTIPSTNLDVNGSTTISGNLNVTGIYRQNGNPLGVWPSNANGIYFNGGNVGIGTDSPTTKLTIKDGSLAFSNDILFTNQETYKFYKDSLEHRFSPFTALTPRCSCDTNETEQCGDSHPASAGDPLACYDNFTKLVGSLQSYDAWKYVKKTIPSNTYYPSMFPSFVFTENFSGTSFTMTNTGNELKFTSSKGKEMVFSVDGSVGIGTTAPMAKLDVGGVEGGIIAGSGNLDPAGSFDFTPLKSSAKLLIGWNRSAGGGEIDLISNRAAGNIGGFNFYDYTNAGTLNHLVSIKGDGSVGIGTAAPAAKLDVSGGIRFDRGHFGNTPTVVENSWLRDAWLTGQGINTNIRWDNTSKKWKRWSSGDPATCYGYNDFGGLLHDSGSIHVIKGACGSATEWTDAIFRSNFTQMTVTSGGNVGIGITGPQAQLDVLDWIRAGGARFHTAMVDGNIAFTDLSHKITTGSNSADTSLAFENSGTNKVMNVSFDGNVGIGTTGTEEKLLVYGGHGIQWTADGTADKTWALGDANDTEPAPINASWVYLTKGFNKGYRGLAVGQLYSAGPIYINGIPLQTADSGGKAYAVYAP